MSVQAMNLVVQNGKMFLRNPLCDVGFIEIRTLEHGEWITHKNSQISYNHLMTNYECSVCHTWSRYHSNYCPDCGAKMDLKEVEE